MKIKITADSTCDLGKELTEKYDVGIMPLTVLLGSEIYHDGVDIASEDILNFVEKTKVLPKTSAPSVDDYTEFFKKQLETNDAVIHFNISAKASASYSNAMAAAAAFPGVRVVDTMALSTGQGLLVLKACDLAAEGKGVDEIVDMTESLIPNVNTSFVPDELDYLHKGGRCSLASLIGAKMLKIHPMIDMVEGQLIAAKRYMGNMLRCLKNYVADLAAKYKTYDAARCFVTHSPADAGLVQSVINFVKEMFSFKEVIETEAGSVVTSHCGRGTIGVLFMAG
ncbi:MAG: DegV family protein [Clostridia bacterium]|nr:DegV family protein [Clostridia bacterium]